MQLLRDTMNENENTTDLQFRIVALEEQIARLSAATLRINSSLDLDVVLQEVVDTARALTSARFGIITTVDKRGQIEEFVMAGFTENEKGQLAAWPDGPRLFEHFRDIKDPVRVTDFREYINTLGFSTDLIISETFLGTPLRYFDEHVGNFFLAEKDGDSEFTIADEDVLRLFASQAANAIANARTHLNEQRARADLQTLIEISPVAVVVFDGNTGEPVSFNREARRIVQTLGTPGGTPEDLLSLVVCRRADGRDVSMAEFPMSRQLNDNPETIHAEEIILSVPDGRSVTLVCNATPIRSEEGNVESLIVTLQDLAPLEELTRLRAEFIGEVSNELRTPLVAIKGSSASVLAANPRPDADEMLQYFRVIDEQVDDMRGLIADLLDYGRIASGALDLSPAPAHMATLIERGCEQFRSQFKYQTIKVNANVNLPKVYVDASRIKQVIYSLLHIASRSSQTSAEIEITATHVGVHVEVRLRARNWYIPEGDIPNLFRRYILPTSDNDDVSTKHANIDLAICRGLVEANGGRIWAESDSFTSSTQITFTLPLASDGSNLGLLASSPQSPASSDTDSSASTQVLVINANPYLHRYIQESLTAPEFETRFVDDDEQLLDHFDTFTPTLVLLDLHHQVVAPREKIATIAGISDAPMIFIAHDGVDDTLANALGAGAVDYIVYPFSRSELIARVRGALRQQEKLTPFVLNELQIDYEQRKVMVGEKQIELTATEYDLLRVLSINAGRVMNYNTLLRQVWGKRNQNPNDPKAVRAVVKRLRSKLDDDATTPNYVCNERGVGYFIPRANDSS